MLDPAPAAPATGVSSTPTSHRAILIGALTLALATLAAKLIAFGKDLVVARDFGAGDQLDAFLVAFLVPSFAVTVLASSFSPAFVPNYIRVMHSEGRAAADRLAGAATTSVTLLFVALSLILPVVGPLILPWLGSGFDEPKLALAQSLLFVVSGVLLASGVSASLTAILQAHDRFVAGALASCAVPAVTLSVLWLADGARGIFALAIGTLLGFIAECVCLLVATWWFGLLPLPRWPARERSHHELLPRYGALALAGVLISASVVVDQAMAASLGSGSVSVLNYGNKIVSFMLGLVAVSLATAIFPAFARMIAQSRWQTLKATWRRYSVGIALGSIPLVLLLAGLAQPLVQLLFEHGAVTSQDTEAASQVQRWLALQVPFYILVTVGFRLLAALDSYRAIIMISAVNLALNIVADWLLMHYFGVTGIAAATSLVQLVGAIATLVAIRGRLAELPNSG